MENDLKAGNQQLIKEFSLNDLDNVLVNRDSTKKFVSKATKTLDENALTKKMLKVQTHESTNTLNDIID